VTQTTYGRWTVISEGARRYGRLRYFLCRCACGTTREIFVGSLRDGRSTSCGCYMTAVHTTHGQSSTSEYRNWQAMLQRCHNPKNSEYRNDGGRGIAVCERWRNSFESFRGDILAELGPRPSKAHSLDRIDNDRGYAPGNVRWATRSEQLHNSRLSASARGRRGADKRWHSASP